MEIIAQPLSLILLESVDNEKHCKSALIKVKFFTAPAAASFSGCRLLHSCSDLRDLEQVGFSFAAIQASGSNVEAPLNPSEIRELEQ